MPVFHIPSSCIVNGILSGGTAATHEIVKVGEIAFLCCVVAVSRRACATVIAAALAGVKQQDKHKVCALAHFFTKRFGFIFVNELVARLHNDNALFWERIKLLHCFFPVCAGSGAFAVVTVVFSLVSVSGVKCSQGAITWLTWILNFLLAVEIFSFCNLFLGAEHAGAGNQIVANRPIQCQQRPRGLAGAICKVVVAAELTEDEVRAAADI